MIGVGDVPDRTNSGDSSEQPLSSGQIGVEPNPASPGGTITITYIGGKGSTLYWRVAGEGNPGWQPLELGPDNTATLQVPEDAKFIDISELKGGIPAAAAVAVGTAPLSDQPVP